MRERMNLTVGQRILAGPPLVMRSTSCWPFFFAFLASLMSAIPAFKRANASVHQRRSEGASIAAGKYSARLYLARARTDRACGSPCRCKLVASGCHRLRRRPVKKRKGRVNIITAIEEVVFAGVAEIDLPLTGVGTSLLTTRCRSCPDGSAVQTIVR